MGCLVDVAVLEATLLLAAARVMAAAARRALPLLIESPLPAALPTADIEAEAFGDSGAYKCSGDKLPSESSLGRDEGGVNGMP